MVNYDIILKRVKNFINRNPNGNVKDLLAEIQPMVVNEAVKTVVGKKIEGIKAMTSEYTDPIVVTDIANLCVQMLLEKIPKLSYRVKVALKVLNEQTIPLISSISNAKEHIE